MLGAEMRNPAETLLEKEQDSSSSPPTKESTFFTIFLAVFSVIEIILYSLFVEYDVDANTSGATDGSFDAAEKLQYLFYLNVSVMMTIGFGFLMSFLRNFGLGSLGYTFLITSFVMPWCILTGKFFSMVVQNGDYNEIYNNSGNMSDLGWGNIQIDTNALLQGQFCAATVLITFGAVIGKTSPSQLLVMALLETVFYSINKEVFCLHFFETADMGGTIFIHLFGAYFGLAVSWILRKPKEQDLKFEESSRISDLLAFVATLFLWVYWPSFNGATAGGGGKVGNTQLYTTSNTILSLCASCMWTFIMTRWLNKARINPVDIQNATLAGGVAIGAASNLDVGPGWALIIGSGAAIISCLGFNLLQPCLEKKISLHDTCGVHNLHGMPAIYGSIISAIALHNTQTVTTNQSQAVAQILGALATLAFAIITGLLTGCILKCIPSTRLPFRDSGTWVVADKQA
jgi:ammonium transporter Rh